MTKYTPGPWQVTPDKTRVNNPDDHEDKQVADCQSGNFHPEDQAECEANARLISAAPELLEGLKDLFAMMDEGLIVRNTDNDHKSSWALDALIFTKRMKKAYDAIAKAEGAGNG